MTYKSLTDDASDRDSDRADSPTFGADKYVDDNEDIDTRQYVPHKLTMAEELALSKNISVSLFIDNDFLTCCEILLFLTCRHCGYYSTRPQSFNIDRYNN